MHHPLKELIMNVQREWHTPWKATPNPLVVESIDKLCKTYAPCTLLTLTMLDS
jgi:hypothetical protein